MKPHIYTRSLGRLQHIALTACLLFLTAQGLGQVAATPGAVAPASASGVGAVADAGQAVAPALGAAPATAASAAPPGASAVRRATPASAGQGMGPQEFAALGKPAVQRMQQLLEVIYRNLPDWKRDAAQRGRPLDDGVLGPVTLSWLQRYAVNFKLERGAGGGQQFAGHMERMAAFAVAHPSELEVLLDAAFEAWDAANPAPVRVRDFAVRRAGDEAALIKLVERYRASRAAPGAPPAPPAAEADGYYTYVLNPEDLDALGGKLEIGSVLAKFKDQPYGSKEALKVALAQALKGRADVLVKLWPVIDKNVHAFEGYALNAANRARLQASGMPAGTLAELAAMGTVYLKSRDALDAFLVEKIEAGELTIDDAGLAQLADATRALDNYHLDQQALDTIAQQLRGSVHYAGVPDTVVKMLAQIKQVDYPDVAIFHSAAKSKLALGLGMCRLNTPVNNAYMANLAIPNDELASLQKALEALRPSAADGRGAPAAELDAHFKQIVLLRDLRQRCSDSEKSQANDIVTLLYDNYLKAAVDSAGRKKMPDEIPPIRIRGGECGCALDDLAGVVYGFYPYWWKQKGWQTVNFRAINRMAYYGLTVDNTGEFRLGNSSFNLRDGGAEANAFVRTARRYNSKVDWLIQKNDWGREWQALNPQSKRAVFQRMRENIGTLLNTPLSNLGARLKGLVSVGKGGAARRGDGVTLYFPNYPEDADSTAQFNEFYLALRAELDKQDLWLNILVSQATLATGKNGTGGAFGLGNQIKLRQMRAVSEQFLPPGVHDNDEYLLVLLNEPSSEAKKALRTDLENDSMLHGAERADFIRSIMPVMHFDDNNWQQLEDDIVYTRDNFGGLGLWAPDFDNLALPVKDDTLSCLQSQQIAVCLLKNFRNASLHDSLPGAVEAFVCVHREVLHWIMLFLIATGGVLIILFFTDCKMQGFMKSHFLWVQLLVAGPALLCFVLLLLYDPYMQSLSQGNLPFFISAGIIMVGIGVGYRFWRSQRQVPQRERGMPQREGTGFPIVVWEIETDKGGFRWLIKNRGNGYAIIKQVEILLDGNPVADAKTALESVLESDNSVLWKSVPLVGQKLEPDEQLVGLSIANSEAAKAFEHKLKAHDLAVKITYCGPNNEHWSSDGAGIRSVPGMS